MLRNLAILDKVAARLVELSKRKERGERERWGDLPRQRNRAKAAATTPDTHWRLLEAFSQSVNLPTTLDPKFCCVCCWRGGKALTTSH